MSGLMNKLFGSETPQPQQQQPVQQAQQAQPQPGNLPADAGATDTNNPQTPPGTSDAANQASGQNNDSPLKDFETLWEPVTDESGKPAEAQPAIPQLKAEDVQKIVAKADFSQTITPDIITAINEGGEGAQQAFASAINAAVSQGVTQAIMVGNKLTETAVTKAIEASESKIPSLLRDQAVSDHMKSSNPLFSNPAVKPVMDATRQQLQLKYPNATHQEITEMTQNYIIAMGKQFSPQEPQSDTPPGETDWTTFL